MTTEKVYSDIQASLWPDDAPTDPTTVTEGYNKLAETYATDVMADGWQATFDMCTSELDKQLPLKKGPIKLLDAGCGDGMLPELFDFSPYNITLYGIDGSKEMLALADAKGTYKELKLTNVVERFPFPDDTFDVIVANGLLGYLEDYKPIYEFMRVLKKGGHFMFTMRVTHYNQRGWAKAVGDMAGKWTVLRADPFDPFPQNPGYTHTYHLVCLTKNLHEMTTEKVYSNIQASLWPDDAPTDPMTVTEGYNKLAETYATDVMADGWQATFDMCNSELDKQLPLKKGPIKLLDAGCGDGMLPELYDFSPYNVTLYGIDGSKEMLALAAAKGTYKELKLTNIVKMFPFSDDTFDVIVANGLLGYLEDYKPIYEFMRVLKKGGHFMFTMRVTHYNQRGWAKAVGDMAGKWTVLRADPFDPFPQNPGYTHTYHLVCLTKNQ